MLERFSLPDSDRHRAMRIVEALCDRPEIHCLVAEGDPCSKCRPRFANGHAFTPASTRVAEQALSLRLKELPKFTGNVVVAAVFYRSNRQRIDVDNLLKLVLDAATKSGRWNDDSQVTAVVGILEHDPERPRTVVAFGHHRTTMERGDSTLKPCKACGNLFNPYRVARRQHCSAECRMTLKEPVPCQWCKKPFKRTNSHSKFCSNPCRHAALTESHRTKGQKPKCEICGKQLSRHGYKRCRSCFLADPRAALGIAGPMPETQGKA